MIVVSVSLLAALKGRLWSFGMLAPALKLAARNLQQGAPFSTQPVSPRPSPQVGHWSHTCGLQGPLVSLNHPLCLCVQASNKGHAAVLVPLFAVSAGLQGGAQRSLARVAVLYANPSVFPSGVQDSEGDVHVVLTQRSNKLPTHSGALG